MVIDFHTHVFPDKIAEKTIKYLAEKCNGPAYTDGTVDGLLAQMEKADCDIAVALPVVTKPSQFDSINNFAAELNEKFRMTNSGVIAFGGIHPLCEDIGGKMKYLKQRGFIGVKIHPDFQDEYIDHEGYIAILKAAKDLDMAVVTHSGMDDGFPNEPEKCPVELVKKVIDKVGHSKFILGHYGGYKRWELVLDSLAGLDVYFDTALTFSKIKPDLFKKILDKHGADRVLFATDCPWSDIEADKNTFYSYGMDKETQDKILYKNALKLLNL
ncbi:MAG: amidohydrolase family protein [Clostridiales bacterium]|nr:amidohydrolase family protein [Clostridiales bacterium]